MRVDELPLRGVGEELFDQRAALRFGQAENPPGVGRQVERLAAGVRVPCAPAPAAPVAGPPVPRR